MAVQVPSIGLNVFVNGDMFFHFVVCVFLNFFGMLGGLCFVAVTCPGCL